MDRVYLVTDGVYSDYSVIAAYSTREKAEFGKKLWGSGNDIEEFALDSLPEHPPGMFLWRVWMDAGGNVREFETTRPCTGFDKWIPHDGLGVCFTQWAEDEQHAIKIANEKRIQLIESNEWTLSWSEWYARKYPNGAYNITPCQTQPST